MKLLIVTQAIDRDDPVLGFFCRWVEEFAKHFERIEVIALKVGKYELPDNVRVHSLGKEHGRPLFGALTYIARFKLLAWRLRHDYDAAFVHMNQEYVLVYGLVWKLLGKPVYMWRNHYAGSFLTNVAGAFCTKVFCTSKHSYTARFKKTELMPVGVDTERFKLNASVVQVPRSILFLARIAPSKRVEMLIDALAQLAKDGVDFTADIVGSPLPEHEEYYASLKERTAPLAPRVRFLPGVPNAETVRLYQSHEIFVNTSPSGMFDKTLFEAAACGCRVLASSKDFAELAGPDTYFDSSEQLAERLKAALEKGTERPLDTLVRQHSLDALATTLSAIIGAPERATA
jgi:glycosyltransferase involved in cell wall biosynthesis